MVLDHILAVGSQLQSNVKSELLSISDRKVTTEDDYPYSQYKSFFDYATVFSGNVYYSHFRRLEILKF